MHPAPPGWRSPVVVLVAVVACVGYLAAGFLDARVDSWLGVDWHHFHSEFAVLAVGAFAQLVLAAAVYFQIRAANDAAIATGNSAAETAGAADATRESVEVMRESVSVMREQLVLQTLPFVVARDWDSWDVSRECVTFELTNIGHGPILEVDAELIVRKQSGLVYSIRETHPSVHFELVEENQTVTLRLDVPRELKAGGKDSIGIVDLRISGADMMGRPVRMSVRIAAQRLANKPFGIEEPEQWREPARDDPHLVTFVDSQLQFEGNEARPLRRALIDATEGLGPR